MQNATLQALRAETHRLREENERLRTSREPRTESDAVRQPIDHGPGREQFFETIIENLYDGVAVVDAEGVVLYESSSVRGITGYPPEEVVGRNFLEFIHPDDLPGIAEQLADHLEYPHEWRSAELRFKHAEGGWRTLEARAVNLVGVSPIDGIVSIYRDVTDQRAAETGLREADDRLQELSDQVPGILYQMRFAPDGSRLDIPYVSEGVRTLLGLDPDEVRANPLTLIEAIHEDDRARYLELAGDAVASVRDFRMDFRCIDRDDRLRWLRVGSTPKVCENGDLLYSGLAMDVTTEKHDSDVLHRNSITLEARVRERTEDLQRANERLSQEARQREQAETRNRLLENRIDAAVRISTIGEMMTGIAHDLQQPLTTIANYAGGCLMRLEQGTLESPEAARIYGEIKDAAMRAAEVVRRAREFTRTRGFDRKPEPINEICEDALALAVGGLRERGVNLHRDLGYRLPLVIADRVPIAQVVLNLLANAADALADQEGERRVILRTARDGAGLRVSVIDNGPGIPEDQREAIFEHFVSTKTERQGLGLGLAICKSIIREHEGEIWVEPSAHDGCAFHFTLPTIEE